MAKKFPYIWAAGKAFGSRSYYMADEEADAIASNAPEGAYTKVYAKDGSGWDGKSWHVVSEIANESFRNELEQLAKQYM